MSRMKKTPKNRDFEVEIIDHNDKNIVDQLVRLEEQCLPLEMRNADSYGYFSRVLNDPKNVNLILRFKNKIVGFLLAKEYCQEYNVLVNHDPDLRGSKKKLFYIDLIQIQPRFKLNGGLRLLLCKLLEESLKKKVKGFCVHARKKNGLSQFMQKIFSCKKLHSIDNWLGFGEQFDYLEAAVNERIARKVGVRINT